MSNDLTNLTRLAPTLSPGASSYRPQNRTGLNTDKTERTSNANVVSLHGTSQPPFVAGQGKPDVTPEELQTAVKQGNEIFQAVQRNLQMEVDDSTKKVVVKVVDQATGDVIRQMPSKEALSFLKQMQEQQGGNGSIIKGLA